MVLHQMAYERLMVVGQKRTLLCAHGENKSVTQEPQHSASIELEENAIHFAALANCTSALGACPSFGLQKNPLFVGVNPCWGIELLASSHGIRSSRIHGPGEGQSLTRTECSELPSWGERTYYRCCSQK